MREAVIVEALRTPMGRHSGIFKNVRTDDLAAYIIAKMVEKTGVNKEEIEDVYFGCTNQAGEDSRNVARNAALLAGLPYTIPGATVNRLCGSGLEAINQAGRAVETDHGDLFVAGGVENMTRGPWVMGKPANAFQRGDVQMYFAPIPNAWGRQGWTAATLSKLKLAELKAALETAWRHAVPKQPKRRQKVRSSQ